MRFSTGGTLRRGALWIDVTHSRAHMDSSIHHGASIEPIFITVRVPQNGGFSLSARGHSPVLILQAAIDWRAFPTMAAGETAPAMLVMLQSMVLCAADAGSGGAR